MPKLFIANATQQVHTFAYRLPESPNLYFDPIRIGQQIQITKEDLPQSTIDAIVGAHRRYGLMSLSEAMRSSQFDGLVYSVDKPISSDQLYQLVERRKSVLHEQGRQLRQDAAIVTDDYINRQMEEAQVLSQRPLRRSGILEMTVEEETRDPSDDTPEISEVIRVDREARDAQPPQQRRRRAS